jgi:DNA topoisomerase-1
MVETLEKGNLPQGTVWITSNGKRVPIVPGQGGTPGPVGNSKANIKALVAVRTKYENIPSRQTVGGGKTGGRPTTVGVGGIRAGYRAATHEELNTLKVPRGADNPKAWTNVQVPLVPGKVLVIGTDSKGRIQQRYSAEHFSQQSVAKFQRIQEFDKKLTKFNPQLQKDVTAGNDTAIALQLIKRTGFRVGSDVDTKAEEKAYGASNLRPEHVKINGDELSFNFTGKKGVQLSKTIVDPQLAKIISGRMDRERLFNTSDSRIRDYVKKNLGDFKVHDFRTWNATANALRLLEGKSAPKNEIEFNKVRNEIGKEVGKFLGDTPAVALGFYIDPRVFENWRNK